MSVYVPGRAPSVVHSSLVHALGVADAASAQALLWFAEVHERHLYRARGHLSIQRYAEVELGFSSRKIEQFIQLAGVVRRFRRLRRSMVKGRLTWTQVRTLAPVLTPASEAHWVARAERLSRRELAGEIAAARARVREKVRVPDQVWLQTPAGAGAAPAAGALPAGPVSGASSAGDEHRADAGSAPGGADGTEPAETEPAETGSSESGPAENEPVEVMTTVTLRLRPLERARLERAVEALRKQGHREDRATLLVLAVEQMAARAGSRRESRSASGEAVASSGSAASSGSPRSGDRAPRAGHQVVVTVCPRCRHASTGVGRTTRPVDALTIETLLCDADVVDQAGHRRATIPPAVRRRVLARDGHRCSAPGCGSTQHLEIHHRVPVAAGGTNDPDNLVTLCHGCHRSLHEIARRRGGTGPVRPHPGAGDDRGKPIPAPGCEHGAGT